MARVGGEKAFHQGFRILLIAHQLGEPQVEGIGMREGDERGGAEKNFSLFPRQGVLTLRARASDPLVAVSSSSFSVARAICKVAKALGVR